MAAPTIVNPESIVALMMAELDDDPSLKPPLLRSLLTDEFLLLPSKVDQLMELPSKVDRMQGQLNNLICNDYERRIARLFSTLVRRRWNLRHARLLQAITRLDDESIPDLANAAAMQGSITDDDAEDLIWADLVLLDTASTPEPVYVVAEVSLTLDDHDVDRAARRARILRDASGNDARPVVIGTGISDANRQRAEDSGVTVILVADREQDRPNPPPATID